MDPSRQYRSAALRVSDSPTHSVRAWVENHDDSWLFIALYVGLAVILSLAISLFWLIVVIGIHAALEWYVHWREHPSPVHTAARVAWEVKLDLGLILFALALTVYMELVMGLLGISAVARGAQASGRFLAWQKAVRGVLLTLDDVAQVARAAVPGRTGTTVDDEPRKAMWGGWSAPWSIGDRLSLGLSIVSAVAMLMAPWVTGMSFSEVVGLLGEEMHPWP
jgi:hypothetical protein